MEMGGDGGQSWCSGGGECHICGDTELQLQVREGGSQGGREGRREGGKEGRKEGGREGGREGRQRRMHR